MSDIRKVFATSDKNYLKRSLYVGSYDLALGGAGTLSTHVITHNLGYIPFIQIGADLAGDGVLWSGDKIDEYTETSLTGPTNVSTIPTLKYWVTATSLTVGLLNDSYPTSVGSRTVWWIIYLDYGES